MTEPSFDLAFMCTANRFRSPLAAALIQRRVAGLPVAVRSYAASGPSGPSVLSQAVERGGRLGVDLAAHVARRVAPAELERVDLVLGFEQTHVATAVIDGGAPRERAFTLPEFVPLAESVLVPEGLDLLRRSRFVVEATAALRTAVGRERPLAELADPVGGPERGYDAAAEEVEALAQRLVRVLFRPADAESRGQA